METDRLTVKMPEGVIRNASRYLVGVGLLLSVVVLWTASNFITASLETGDNSWNKPFLITYLNTASFSVYLIPTIWRYYKNPKSIKTDRPYEPLLQEPRRSTSLTRGISPSPRAPIVAFEPVVESNVERLSIRETAAVAAWWSAVWFIANWAVTASLAWTSVASVTILSSTSGFFTLALGRVFGVETLTRTKIFAVSASFLGVIIVTRSDSVLSSTSIPNLPTHPIMGDCAALVSACFYAIYVVLLKVRVGDEDRADMQLMLGFAGLFNIICLIPVFPILHLTGWETLELPPTRQAWVICGINMCITLSSDYLYVLAMLKTTPMLVTIGLSLTIPLALVASLFIPSSSADAITPLSLIGAVLVFLAFAILGMQGLAESQGEVEPDLIEERIEESEAEPTRGRTTA